MKRYGNLYTQICDIENIRLAHMRARRGKRHYAEVRLIDNDPDTYFEQIHLMLASRTFRNSPYEIFTRIEKGKTREIFKLPYYPDRIIHHCAMNVLEPIWYKTFIRDTYSSLRGRGVLDGLRRLETFLADEENTRYCFKLDVRKFYPSIDHDVLKEVIRRSIKCPGTLWLLDEIIDSAPGVPIGNYLSQYFANLYLSYFDHWAKEELKARYYLRYCDDIVILHSDKTVLHDWHHRIERYLMDRLKLKIKSNWQIFPTRTRGIDFLGYRFFGTHTLVRRRISSAFKRKVAKIRKLRPVPATIINTTMSYYGWLKHANARNLWKSQITREVISVMDAVCTRHNIGNPLRGKI